MKDPRLQDARKRLQDALGTISKVESWVDHDDDAVALCGAAKELEAIFLLLDKVDGELSYTVSRLREAIGRIGKDNTDCICYLDPDHGMLENCCKHGQKSQDTGKDS